MRRRRWLKLGLGAAALLALAGAGAVAVVEPGLRAGRLTAAGQRVFSHVGRAFLDGSLPAEPTHQRVALQAFLARVDALTSALPSHAQQELSQLLALLATGAGRRLIAGLDAPWPHADLARIQAALESMRISPLALRQQAYQALHDITGAAYFSDPSTWSVLGYPGPVAV
ncbi:MAG: hypothetical protein ACXWC2_14170 [Ramlibacter sp.]